MRDYFDISESKTKNEEGIYGDERDKDLEDKVIEEIAQKQPITETLINGIKSKKIIRVPRDKFLETPKYFDFKKYQKKIAEMDGYNHYKWKDLLDYAVAIKKLYDRCLREFEFFENSDYDIPVHFLKRDYKELCTLEANRVLRYFHNPRIKSPYQFENFMEGNSTTKGLRDIKLQTKILISCFDENKNEHSKYYGVDIFRELIDVKEVRENLDLNNANDLTEFLMEYNEIVEYVRHIKDQKELELYHNHGLDYEANFGNIAEKLGGYNFFKDKNELEMHARNLPKNDMLIIKLAGAEAGYVKKNVRLLNEISEIAKNNTQFGYLDYCKSFGSNISKSLCGNNLYDRAVKYLNLLDKCVEHLQNTNRAENNAFNKIFVLREDLINALENNKQLYNSVIAQV